MAMPLTSGLSVITEGRYPGHMMQISLPGKGGDGGMGWIFLLYVLFPSILTAALGRRLMIIPILEKKKQGFGELMIPRRVCNRSRICLSPSKSDQGPLFQQAQETCGPGPMLPSKIINFNFF